MSDAADVDVKQVSGKYARYIIAIYQMKIDSKFDAGDDMPFDKSDIEAARKEYGLDRIKNVPDLKYNLRSRSDLPAPLLESGYKAIIQDEDAQRSDAAYLLTTEVDTVTLPAPDRRQVLDTTGIPPLVQRYSTTDEQGILTRVRYTNVLNSFTGLDCYHLQSHLRTSGDSGQVEIDDLYIAEDDDDQHYAIVAEGKGEGEKFSRNQIFRNVQAIRGKVDYPAAVEALGIKANDNETFSIVEFAVPHNPDETVEIKRVWEYSLPDSDHETLENF